MSVIIVIGGGPKPNAHIVSVMNMPSAVDDVPTYEIRDGSEVLAVFSKLSHASALLPLIQSGE